jgi:hypothetical protein
MVEIALEQAIDPKGAVNTRAWAKKRLFNNITG